MVHISWVNCLPLLLIKYCWCRLISCCTVHCQWTKGWGINIFMAGSTYFTYLYSRKSCTEGTWISFNISWWIALNCCVNHQPVLTSMEPKGHQITTGNSCAFIMQFPTFCEDGLYGQTRTDFLHLYIHGMLSWIFSDFYMYTGLCKSHIVLYHPVRCHWSIFYPFIGLMISKYCSC